MVLRFAIEERTLVLLAALCACLPAITGALLDMLFVGDAERIERAQAGYFHFSPVPLAIIGFVSTIGTALCVGFVGRIMGGRGSNTDALKAVVWHSCIALVPLIPLQVLAAMDVPIAYFLLFVMYGVLFVVFAIFVQVLHGFRSLFLTILGVMLSAFIFLSALLSVFMALGLVPTV